MASEYSYTGNPMRITPFLVLMAAIIPASLNAGLALTMRAVPDETAKFHEQWMLVKHAEATRDLLTLRGMLLPHGVTLAAKNGEVSKAVLAVAAEAWNSALGFHIVTVVDSPNDANVTVSLVDGIDKDRASQGFINVYETEDGAMSADVQVDGFTGHRPLNDRERAAVITHELGHFLGLEDLPGEQQIMGEFDPNELVTRPSRGETEAILYLRNGIRTAIRNLGLRR